MHPYQRHLPFVKLRNRDIQRHPSKYFTRSGSGPYGSGPCGNNSPCLYGARCENTGQTLMCSCSHFMCEISKNNVLMHFELEQVNQKKDLKIICIYSAARFISTLFISLSRFVSTTKINVFHLRRSYFSPL